MKVAKNSTSIKKSQQSIIEALFLIISMTSLGNIIGSYYE